MSEGELDAASPSRPVWSSQRAYILATIAGVIGLGNLWRFPYMVGLNGGGTFILAYVICILVLAVPLAALEVQGWIRRTNVYAHTGCSRRIPAR